MCTLSNVVQYIYIYIERIDESNLNENLKKCHNRYNIIIITKRRNNNTNILMINYN